MAQGLRTQHGVLENSDSIPGLAQWVKDPANQGQGAKLSLPGSVAPPRSATQITSYEQSSQPVALRMFLNSYSQQSALWAKSENSSFQGWGGWGIG